MKHYNVVCAKDQETLTHPNLWGLFKSLAPEILSWHLAEPVASRPVFHPMYSLLALRIRSCGLIILLKILNNIILTHILNKLHIHISVSDHLYEFSQ